MIDYVEIRDKSLELLGLIDTAKSVIWETQYYGAGAFEIYVEATPQAISMLQVGNFITRVENEGVGIIEAVEVVLVGGDGRMITASGRLAKSILDRRLITYVNGNTGAATFFSGNVEARARGLVQDNAIACYKDKKRTIPYTQRNISLLQLGALAGLPAVSEQRQVNCDNLLEYTDAFLQQYNYGAKLIRAGNKLAYTVYSGIDRSIGNAAGNEPVIFSEDFDNLTGSNYALDETERKTFALIGGEGEGIDRFYVERNASLADLERREVFVDSSTARELYEDKFTGDGVVVVDAYAKDKEGDYLLDDDGNRIPTRTHIEGTATFALTHAATAFKKVTVGGAEAVCTLNAAAGTITFKTIPLKGVEVIVQYIDDNEYREQLSQEGAQELATLVAAESFAGSIDLANSTFKFGVDFEIGDIVTVQDNGINKYINVRVIAAAEVQDDEGYQVNIEFEAV